MVKKNKFALIGAAGYIAPKHMEAIKAVNGELIAAYDPNDSVGVLDSYFPDCKFFSLKWEFERFIYDNKPDYAVICSPNDTHFDYITHFLLTGIDVICEKPLVLKKEEIETLELYERTMGGNVYGISQLRLTKAYQEIKALSGDWNTVHIEYHTFRGDWYHKSWKGDKNKSGGLITNIGIHFLDMCISLFGECERMDILYKNERRTKGGIMLKHASVTFDLSIDHPTNEASRIIEVNGFKFDLSKDFRDLHVKSYQEILSGNGFTVSDLKESILLAKRINKA